MKKERLKKRFVDIFGRDATPEIYRAPGRVNLIGEHTDYNDGLVFPIAINLATYGLISPTGDDQIRVFSEDLESFDIIDLDGITEKKSDWTDYVRGVLAGIENLTGKLTGFDLYISSRVPVGSGLSSSAALEIVTAVGVLNALDLSLPDDLEIIKLCQRAENDFVGANTGIMDQYASYFGREGEALLIDTAKLTHESVRLNLTGYELLVIDTTVSHTHGGNEYNKRREECEAALTTINESAGEAKYTSLSQLSLEDFHNYKDQLPKKLADRAKHVVTENERVKRAAASFREGDVDEAGKLFYASHSSLRDLYEVSSTELDFLVDFARSEDIPGARMTGGGFGGSTIHLVPEDRLKVYAKKAAREFEAEFGISPGVFPVSASDGARFRNPVL